MAMDMKTPWAWTGGIALVTLIGVGVLMWPQPDRRVAHQVAPSPATETLPPENAPGERPLLRPETADTQGSKHDRALAEMQQQMTALRVQMRQLQHAHASRGADQPPPATPIRDAAAPADPRALQEAARQTEARLRAKAAHIEETLKTEKADASWAPVAETALATVLQHEELQALQLVSVVCRSTLCRLDLAAHDVDADESAFDEELRKLLLFTPWSGPAFGRVAPDGPSPTAVFFLAREGYSLPHPTP